MDQPFPPLGVKLVASNDRNLKVIVKLRRPIAQTSPVFPPLREGGALAVVVKALPENRCATQVFPRPHPLKRRGWAPRVPLPSGGDGGAQKGRKWRERPPFLPLLVRHRAGMTIAHQIVHFSSPFPGGRSLHRSLIPAGRLSGRPGSRLTRKTADHKCPTGQEGQAWGMHTTRFLRSAARAACHSTGDRWAIKIGFDGLGLGVDTRLTCPSRSFLKWSNGFLFN